mmetsp:Transcript_8092/g.11681  ORF Transcript_8092/g.11681 Transcript_8092/m.11681 type:complete len:95 (+) Transcript_8092:394-678(+)
MVEVSRDVDLSKDQDHYDIIDGTKSLPVLIFIIVGSNDTSLSRIVCELFEEANDTHTIFQMYHTRHDTRLNSNRSTKTTKEMMISKAIQPLFQD